MKSTKVQTPHHSSVMLNAGGAAPFIGSINIIKLWAFAALLLYTTMTPVLILAGARSRLMSVRRLLRACVCYISYVTRTDTE